MYIFLPPFSEGMIRSAQKLSELQYNLEAVSDRDNMLKQSNDLQSQYLEFMNRWHQDMLKKKQLEVRFTLEFSLISSQVISILSYVLS